MQNPLASFIGVRDDRGFQVNPICCHDITRSDRQIGNRTSSEKLQCHFHLVFPVMPDEVAFERITLITGISRSNSASCWQRNNLHLKVCGMHWCLSANMNKKLQNCFEKVLKF